MGIKDDVKVRRQQKIKVLLERNNEPVGTKKTASSVSPVSHKLEPFSHPAHSVFESERDPELVWKSQPNPWSRWEDGTGGSDVRNFTQGPILMDKDDPYASHSRHSFRKELQWKLLVAIIIFAGVWGMFQYNHPWTLKGQAFVKQALTDEVDFAAVAAWYKNTFAGAPSFIPIFKEEAGKVIEADGKLKLPIVSPLAEATIVHTFAELLNGIELAGQPAATVMAVETGRVIVVTDQQDSVVIQHANQRVTIYSKLDQTTVKVNDWVEAGDPIGQLMKAEGDSPSLLYFAVKENDLYVDPLDVIPLD